MVLYNGMASTSSWAALYFVALMTFGNYVLFNLLVAILVEGFQAEVRRQGEGLPGEGAAARRRAMRSKKGFRSRGGVWGPCQEVRDREGKLASTRRGAFQKERGGQEPSGVGRDWSGEADSSPTCPHLGSEIILWVLLSTPHLPGRPSLPSGMRGPHSQGPHPCLVLCGVQGDANRSDTDEDKTSVHFEEDFHKLRELQTTGACGQWVVRVLVGGVRRAGWAGPPRASPRWEDS